MSSRFSHAVRRRALQTTSLGVLAAVLAAAALAPTGAAAQGPPAENEPLELGPLRVEDQNQMPLQQESGLARLPGTVQNIPFAPKPDVRLRSNRAAGIAAVAVIHGLLALGFVFASPRFYKPAEHQMTVVSIVPEIQKKIDPPPVMPVFEPPAVYIPQPITPEVVLTTPTPPPVITLAPAPPTPVQAPIVQTPPPVIGRAVTPPPISGADRKAFATTLLGHLNRYKRYPASARMRRQEGVVSLRFTMDRHGHVLSYEIAKTSGLEALDNEARKLIKRAEPLPAIPASFRCDTLDLVVPIEFFLN